MIDPYKENLSMCPLAATLGQKLNLSPYYLSVILFVISLCFSPFAEARTWTSAVDSTETFEAKFKSLDSGIVKFVKNNGRFMRVRLKILSAADQEYIKKADSESKAKTEAVREGLTVYVLGGDWKFSNKRLAKILQHSAGALTKHFKGKELIDIDVRKGSGPFTAYGVNRRGHKAVTITPEGSIWNQQVYQFAHELCHTLCRHRNGDKSNLWFEESICEMASIYVLDRVGEGWKKNPPLSGNEGYAKHFTSYALKLKNKKTRKIPVGMTFAKWFEESRQKLIDGKGDARELQGTVALQILPMVEKTPEYWGAFYYLDVGKTREEISFETFLKEWQQNSPPKYHPFIKDIGKLFYGALVPPSF